MCSACALCAHLLLPRRVTRYDDGSDGCTCYKLHLCVAPSMASPQPRPLGRSFAPLHLTFLAARLRLPTFLFYHPWQPMRPVHGAAVMTLTSEARGCKLLHKHRCAVQTWSLHQKKKKKSTKESREPKATAVAGMLRIGCQGRYGCKQLIADARPTDGANKSAKDGT